MCHRARLEATTDVSISTASWLSRTRSFITCSSLYHPVSRFCRLYHSCNLFALRDRAANRSLFNQIRRLPAYATPRQAAEAALRVVLRCVERTTPTGGAAIDFGQTTLSFHDHPHGPIMSIYYTTPHTLANTHRLAGGDNNLSVTVSAFEPFVECHEHVGGPGIFESCQGIIDRMNTSHSYISFGPQSGPHGTVLLPHHLRAGKCSTHAPRLWMTLNRELMDRLKVCYDDFYRARSGGIHDLVQILGSCRGDQCHVCEAWEGGLLGWHW